LVFFAGSTLGYAKAISSRDSALVFDCASTPFDLRKLACATALVVALGGAAAAASAQTGLASVYGYSGGQTASGVRASPTSLTAAHRSLPFGTLVRVTNDANGRSVVVRIIDRGPFARGRVIDVTPAAARALGFSGLARVTLTVLGRRPAKSCLSSIVSSK
jgi:rare lipoprotein A